MEEIPVIAKEECLEEVVGILGRDVRGCQKKKKTEERLSHFTLKLLKNGEMMASVSTKAL